MAKRRGNGEGNITLRKDGRWMARLTEPTPAEPKPRKTITLYGRTRKEVADKLAAAIAARNAGTLVLDDGTTFGEFLGRWLDVTRHSLKATSYEAYERSIRVHVAPALGDVRLAKLTPGHLQSYYGAKLAEGMAPASVRLQHQVMHRALAMAQKWRLVVENVADATDPPKPRAEEMKPLDREQARRFLDAARGHRHEALFVLAITTGMRIGELLGLRWGDIDAEAGTLRVERTLSAAKSGPRFTSPKSGKGRNVKLPAIAVAALKAHRARQNAERLALGDAWQDLNLVFPARDGGPLDRTNLTRDNLAPLLRRAELPAIRFHDLRHTAATLLLSQGVHPKLVQELLGHSSVAMTIDRYSHVLPGMGDQTAAAMVAALS
jgi:integrase